MAVISGGWWQSQRYQPVSATVYTIPTDGLIARYGFETTTWTDTITRCAATQTGTITTNSDCKVGLRSANFPGPHNNYLTTTNGRIFNNSQALTISMWEKQIATNPPYSSPIAAVSTDIEVGFRFSPAAGVNRFFFTLNKWNVIAQVVPVQPLNVWTHVIATWATTNSGGDGKIRVYTNGVLATTTGAYNTKITQTGVLRFGVDAVDLDGRCWIGRLDDVLIWNRALSPTEATNLYLSYP
jgi:hypothetical protein